MISISAELVALGWGVEVYANPSLNDTGLDARGVLWLPHWAYEIDGEIDGEIAAPLPLLRSAWLRGELPRAGPGSLGPQVAHLCVET